MNIEYRNEMTAADYKKIRQAVGWEQLSDRMSEAAVANSYYLLAGYVNNEPVAMVRVISDGGYLALMYDLMVTPACQSHQVGTYLIEQIKQFLMKDLEPGEEVMLHVMSIKGKEGFYEKMGFWTRPDESLGAGMSIWLTKQ